MTCIGSTEILESSPVLSQRHGVDSDEEEKPFVSFSVVGARDSKPGSPCQQISLEVLPEQDALGQESREGEMEVCQQQLGRWSGDTRDARVGAGGHPCFRVLPPKALALASVLLVLLGIFLAAATLAASGRHWPSPTTAGHAEDVLGNVVEEFGWPRTAYPVLRNASSSNLTISWDNPLSPQSGPIGPEDLPALKATCVIDVVQAVASLGEAIVSIHEAEEFCPDQTKARCGKTVSKVIGSLAWVASFLSYAATTCAGSIHHINHQALCSGDITSVIDDLAKVAGSSSGVVDDCDSHFERRLARPSHPARLPLPFPPAPTATAAPAPHGDHAEHFVEEAKEGIAHRDYGIALCHFDVTQAAAFVTRAVLQIRSAAKYCKDPRVCAVDLLHVISSFAFLAQFLTLAVADCPTWELGSVHAAHLEHEGGRHDMHERERCAADISEMTGAVASFSAATMAAMVDCKKHPDGHLEVAMLPAGGRRLVANDTEDRSSHDAASVSEQ